MWLPFLGLLTGIVLGIIFPLGITIVGSKMLAIVCLSLFDTLFLGLNLKFDNNFNTKFFTLNFFLNTIIGLVIVYLGSIINTDLFIAVSMVFCIKIFYNLSRISRSLFLENQ